MANHDSTEQSKSENFFITKQLNPLISIPKQTITSKSNMGNRLSLKKASFRHSLRKILDHARLFWACFG
jgi:hypothetical protein